MEVKGRGCVCVCVCVNEDTSISDIQTLTRTQTGGGGRPETEEGTACLQPDKRREDGGGLALRAEDLDESELFFSTRNTRARHLFMPAGLQCKDVPKLKPVHPLLSICDDIRSPHGSSVAA